MNLQNNPRKNILLVEDERITGMMVQKILGKRGYNTLIASSGEEAIETVEKTTGIDLILMDINLGEGIDGAEAAERILQRHELPIVFLSSHTEHEIVEKTERISSYGYVVKNSEETVLLASIRMAFKLFEARLNEKANREALQKSEEKYRGMFDNSILGIFQTTLDGRCHMVNLAFARMLGYDSPEEVKTVVTDIAAQLYADPLDRHRLIEKMKTSGATVRDYEVQMKRKDGTMIWTLLNTRLIIDHEESVPLIEGTYYEITEHKLSDERINNLLNEKELILKEVHHRIKNNMNTIYSLLSLQANEGTNPAIKMILDDAAGRIKSMMILYDKLYRSENTAKTSIREYLSALIRDTIELFPGKESLRIITQIEDIELDARVLSPLGIIIYELVNNAMRYAFMGQNECIITVKAYKKAKNLCIVFQDNGSGMPESMSFENSSGFGLQLINMLVIQMKGSVSIERNGGTRFIIHFSID